MDNPHTPTQTALQPTGDATPALTDDSPGYIRVSPEKAALIVRIKRLNPKVTLQEIADATGYSVPTVSRWLAALDNDTVPEARKLAKSQALRATMKLEDQVDHADPRVSQGAAKALVALAGVQEGSAQVQVGVQVIVGSSSQPAGPDPFDAPVNVIDSAPAKS